MYNTANSREIKCLKYMFILIFAILLAIYYIQNYKQVPIGSSVTLSANDQLINISSDSDVKVINNKYFSKLIEAARKSPRKRIMTDITKNPKENSMQVLINTWTDGSYSPIHYHPEYSEVFSILEGALAFFTFTNIGEVTCHILSSKGDADDRAIIVEKQQFHGMTAAPASMGYPGFAIIFENSGHTFNPSKKTKYTAKWAPVVHKEWGIDGDPKYFEEILKKCPPSPNK